MRLRDYRDSDADGLAQLFTASVHELAVDHYDARQREAWAPRPPDIEVWRSRLAGLRTVVAEDDGRPVGFLSYESDGHVDLLYTAPREARRGAATALLHEVTVRLRDLGVTEMFTEASLVAAPFFERHGFVAVEVQDVRRRGVVLRRHAMRKVLAPSSDR